MCGFRVCSIGGAAAAAKWLTVPREAHVTSSRAGPFPALPPVSPSVGADRDKQCPRDEASVQRVTKELDPGTLPGPDRERERKRERGDI